MPKRKSSSESTSSALHKGNLKSRRVEGKTISTSRIKLRKNKIQSSNTSTKINAEIRDPAADLDIEKKEELSAVDKISDDADETPIEPTSPVLEEERNVSVPSMTEDIPTKQTNMFGNEEMSEEENLLEYYNNLIKKAKELQKNSVDDK